MQLQETAGFGDRGPSDPNQIFVVLAKHQVDYVVIGGIATIAHGNTRNTRDVDIVADSSLDNLQKLAAAFRELGAQLWGVDAHLLGIDIYDPHVLAEGANFTLQTQVGGLDFFNEVPGGVPYVDLSDRSLKVKLAGTKIKIAGKDDLIRMKQAAGRPQDLADIAALTAEDAAK